MKEENGEPQSVSDVNCPTCEGTGWERVVEDGFEKVKRCQCFYQVRRKRLLLAARIPRRYSHCTLAKFEVGEIDSKSPADGKQVSAAIAKDAAECFIRQYPHQLQQKGILFMGSCGVGKTHLAVAIVRELIEKKGIPCLFYDFRDLLKEIQASYDQQSQISELSILEPVLSAEVLLLDELGAAKVTDWMRDTLTYILNTRYNEDLSTLITSNWLDVKRKDKEGEETLEERIGTRLRSRLYEMCKVYEIIGDDFRKKNAGFFS
ncbi:MAG: ATP-binding protein [bacterium]